MYFLLAQAAQADATISGGASVAVGAAVGVVVTCAVARLSPFIGAWLRGHNHPLAAEGFDVAGEYAEALESGKSPAAALESTMRSPEAQDLVAKAVAHFGGSKK